MLTWCHTISSFFKSYPATARESREKERKRERERERVEREREKEREGVRETDLGHGWVFGVDLKL